MEGLLPAVGAHLSVARGLRAVVEEARRLGLDGMQIFVRSPRGTRARDFPPQEADWFLAAVRRERFFPVVVHCSYVCNPAAARRPVYELACRLVAEDLERCRLLGAHFLVLHPGAHTTSSPAGAERRLARLLASVLAADRGDTLLLLEGMAGAGTELGGDFAQLARVLARVGHQRLGVCLDTCHLYAAGYDVTTTAGLERLAADIDATIGRQRVHLVHANDSLAPLGSRRDRHAPLGDGLLGERGLAAWLHHPFFGCLPLIIETPHHPLSRDLELLRRLAAAGGFAGGA